jgi:hypothetical protein
MAQKNGLLHAQADFGRRLVGAPPESLEERTQGFNGRAKYIKTPV